MDWLMLHSRGILQGSLSSADNTTQLIWIKLLCIANETRDRDGYLRYKEGAPYSRELLCTRCNVTDADMVRAIDDFMDDIRDGKPRIEYADDGSLRINNWLDYQTSHKAVKETTPRLRSILEEEAITRHMVNRHPDAGRDALDYGFQDTIIDKDGKMLKNNLKLEGVKDDTT